MLEGGEPTVAEVFTEAQAAGAREVVLTPAYLLPDLFVVAWLRRVVGHWLQSAPVPRPEVRLAAALTSSGGVAEELLSATEGPTTPSGTAVAPMTIPDRAQVPRHRPHVLVCRGPRCLALGASEVAGALQARLSRRGLGDDDVLVTQTGCLSPCALEPMLVVHPDDAWYGGMDPERVTRVVTEQLASGRRVWQWLAPRSR